MGVDHFTPYRGVEPDRSKSIKPDRSKSIKPDR